MLLLTQWIAKFCILNLFIWEMIEKQAKLIWFIRGRMGMFSVLQCWLFSPFENVWHDKKKMLIGPISLTFYFTSIFPLCSAQWYRYCNVERVYWPLFIFQCFIFGCFHIFCLCVFLFASFALWVCACVPLLSM